jgi:peptide chain release factor subunit 1
MATSSSALSSHDEDLEMFKFKRTLKRLKEIQGDGTSMITLLLPPDYQISRANSMLTEETGKASNIKSRVNRQSVETAIKSSQSKLKMYNKIPPNGLALFCGIALDDNQEKKISIAFEPIKPLTCSVYMCDSLFHVDMLEKMMTNNQRYGFIIVDGKGALYSTLCGNHKETLYSFDVDLPSKHGRGGQSALRFARLRIEAHNNYIRKVAEAATKHFITNDVPNVKGIIFAGAAQFKDKIQNSDLLDQRIKNIIIASVDISYGGESGFEQAVQQSSAILSDVKYLDEKRILLDFMTEISKDTDKYVYGLNETIDALENGAVEKCIVYEGSTLMIPKERLQKDSEPITLVDWALENISKYGATLYIVSSNTSEGSQFVSGFGGVGGILRYGMKFTTYDTEQNDDEPDDFI